MNKKRPLGPKICFFLVSAILTLVMGYVVISCLQREKQQPYIDVCKISSKRSSTP